LVKVKGELKMPKVEELEEIIMQVCRENPYRKNEILDILEACAGRTDEEMPMDQPPVVFPTEYSLLNRKN